jgi:nucleoside phosphorylase
VVASSDLFGITGQRIAALRQRFATDLIEMESAPLARICETFGVPYLVVRAGSNLAQEAPNDDYLRLGPIAARQAALFSLHLLRMSL